MHRKRAGAAGRLKVLELGQLIAGPFAAKTLADFGAEVIKVEPPPDPKRPHCAAAIPLRKWRLLKDGTSVWWQVQSRNKRSLALDLKQPEAQDIVRRLARDADVLIENFRPGAMEGWGWARHCWLNPPGRRCASAATARPRPDRGPGLVRPKHGRAAAT